MRSFGVMYNRNTFESNLPHYSNGFLWEYYQIFKEKYRLVQVLKKGLIKLKNSRHWFLSTFLFDMDTLNDV